MVTATANVITHEYQDARDAAGIILASVRGATLTDAVTALARAYARGSAVIGRAVVTHNGYQRCPVPAHFDESTALYRVTLGRLI